MSVTLTIDEGTTSTRALLIADDGTICGIAQQEFSQIFPQTGWVEHDAEEIWTKTLAVCRAVIQACSEAAVILSEAKDLHAATKESFALRAQDDMKITINKQINPSDITNIAITNQRETTVVWDRSSGKPIHNAIVWQCRRTSDYCAKLRADKGFNNYVRKTTGLYIDSYFSGPKLRWILDHHANNVILSEAKDSKNDADGSLLRSQPQVHNLRNHNDKTLSQDDVSKLAFGTIDSWLIYKLTGGRSHLTEPSNAARTMLYDIVAGKWSSKILSKLKIPASILPEVVASNSNFGTCNLFDDLIGHPLTITGVLGDQQAALYAYHATNTVIASKVTYGTGTFVLVELPKFQLRDGLVTTVFYQHAGAKALYAVEGSVFTGGAVVQWLRDGLKIIENSSEIEALANSVEDHGGVYLVPALAGLGAPYWREDIRGTIFGISRGTQRGHIARAALEAMAFRVRDIFEALGLKLEQVNVDGGATANNLLMQFQADLLQMPIQKYSTKEMTALGAAIMAKTTGGKEEKIRLRKDTCYLPKLKLEKRYTEWKAYVGKLIS